MQLISATGWPFRPSLTSRIVNIQVSPYTSVPAEPDSVELRVLFGKTDHLKIQPTTTLEDFIAARSLIRRISSEEENIQYAKPVEDQAILDQKRASRPDSYYLVLKDTDGKVVGTANLMKRSDVFPFCSNEERVGLVADVYLNQDIRRRGNGTRLIEQLENAAQAIGYERLVLFNAEPNHAKAFFEMNGFKVCDQDSPDLPLFRQIHAQLERYKTVPHMLMEKPLKFQSTSD